MNTNTNTNTDMLHRDNGLPAMEYTNGNKEWYQDGELHCDNDLPAIEIKCIPAAKYAGSGKGRWYRNGK
jgi:hypothetical protein